MRTNIAIRVSIAALTFACSGLGHGAPVALELPANVIFLDVPPNAIEGRFVLNAGKVNLESVANKRVEANLPVITKEPLASYRGEGRYILGAPAVVLGERTIEIPESLADPGATIRGSLVGDAAVLVKEKRETDPSEAGRVITSFSVYLAKNGKAEPLQTFSFDDNIYNQYLDQVWPVDRRTLAIVTKSSRHAAISTLFLFDRERKAVVGMREFSKFQYLPERQSFWMMQSVANCDNLNEVLDAAKKNAAVFPIYTGGAISEAFKDITGIKQKSLSR